MLFRNLKIKKFCPSLCGWDTRSPHRTPFGISILAPSLLPHAVIWRPFASYTLATALLPNLYCLGLA